ncbi:MAG TPA: small multi-drug export protein [Candidatus Desulfobacillus denitrificans]|nr:small multi-drug export protein [Candidatus Desulfobacillus denitrificans]HNT63581.1 small multi-drug export protein [Candidatus Desulfobacillus denitrificans]
MRKFGIVGLLVFVFAPFWMTGPVVGSIIGFLIGLRPWVNLAVVLCATYAAIGVWALLLNELSAWAATFHRLAPWALLAAIVLIVLAGHLLQRRRIGRC